MHKWQNEFTIRKINKNLLKYSQKPKSEEIEKSIV